MAKTKLLEYKVKNGKLEVLDKRMDIIPTSLALAQQQKKGMGDIEICLRRKRNVWAMDLDEMNEPLFKDKSKTHKILKFPILRASVNLILTI